MHPAERALLLDTARRFLIANESQLADWRRAQRSAWDSAAQRAAIERGIVVLEVEITRQRMMIADVEQLGPPIVEHRAPAATEG